MDAAVIEEIKKEARDFAKGDNIISQDFRRRNPGDPDAPAASLEQEMAVADVVMSAPFLRELE